jgi:hypothetical protein
VGTSHVGSRFRRGLPAVPMLSRGGVCSELRLGLGRGSSPFLQCRRLYSAINRFLGTLAHRKHYFDSDIIPISHCWKTHVPSPFAAHSCDCSQWIQISQKLAGGTASLPCPWAESDFCHVVLARNSTGAVRTIVVPVIWMKFALGTSTWLAMLCHRVFYSF